jgi:hypothetical protein
MIKIKITFLFQPVNPYILEYPGISSTTRLLWSSRAISRSLPCLSVDLLNKNSNLAQELFNAAFGRPGKYLTSTAFDFTSEIHQTLLSQFSLLAEQLFFGKLEVKD